MKHHSTQRDYWRSLEHLAQSPEIAKFADHEFPGYDPDDMLSFPPASRRRFLQIVSAGMALAGLTVTGCRRWPEEHLAPYTSAPGGRMPGLPEQYATSFELGGVSQPLLVTSFDGRPIKVEGNPIHPFSATIVGKQGAATGIAQASVLDMYDPHRSRGVVEVGNENATETPTFETFKAAFGNALASAGQGEKLAVLIEATSSPSTARLKDACLAKYPKLSWYEYEPLSGDNELAGMRLATGQAARPMLHLDQANVVVSFDCDFVGSHPAQIRYASDWSAHRRSADDGKMNRVYVIESAFTLTGSVADHRLPATPSHVLDLLAAVAKGVGVTLPAAPAGTPTPAEQKLIDQITADLKANAGTSVVAIGANLPPAAHHLGVLINDAIGAINKTVTLHDTGAGDRPSHFDAIADLAKQIRADKFDTLLILGGNPAYDAPADLDFAAGIKSVATSAILSLYFNETSSSCKWHAPRAHYLEAWGDARAWDGTVGIVQPLIEPLFGGKTIDEVLAVVAGSTETTSDAIVRKTISGNESAYRKTLHDGMQADSAFKIVNATIKPLAALPTAAGDGFQVRFLPSGLYDGRFAPNAWLQEIPDTLTKLVWDNAALLSKADADKNSITTGDMIKLNVGGKSMDIVAYVLPGQPIGVIGLQLGYGRSGAGPVGSDVGFNTYLIRTSSNPWIAAGATISKLGKSYPLSLTQNHQLIDKVGFDGREERVGDKGKSAELIFETTLEKFKADPAVFKRNEDGTLTLKQLYDGPIKSNDIPEPHRWGMAVDMNSCIGCNACVVACQAENNIPVVGKYQVSVNRQMHWIRIDRYFKGDAADPENDPNPEVAFQPVMCQHCENAPCEQVCPVGATSHDTEGLNVMVYNRCIGTRYCSNNCPYKVRRFNYLDWHSQDPRHDSFPKPYPNVPDLQQREQVDPIHRMVYNPEVTVRMRGVMEKCTYCVQRIHNTKTAKRARGEEVVDGDILTACQQTCPTQAIVFGDLKDADSRVSKLRDSKRAYSLLSDLDTRPRTQYLALVRNPGEEKA